MLNNKNFLVEPHSSNKDFWDNRWESQQTGWDIGYASPPIIEFMKNYPNKDATILIPGCGNAYEADFLLKEGFTNITVIDIAPKAVEKLQAKFFSKPQIKILCEDFFTHNGFYDLIIEQTFFCAIHPSLRANYAKKSYELLKNNGFLVGVMFNTEFEKVGPPFGGFKDEYKVYFENYFNIHKMENCYNSIAPRLGKEIFVKMEKK